MCPGTTGMDDIGNAMQTHHWQRFDGWVGSSLFPKVPLSQLWLCKQLRLSLALCTQWTEQIQFITDKSQTKKNAKLRSGANNKRCLLCMCIQEKNLWSGNGVNFVSQKSKIHKASFDGLQLDALETCWHLQKMCPLLTKNVALCKKVSACQP